MKVTIFERDCGATTGFSTQASLLEANRDLPGDSGNVLVIHGGVAPGGAGGPAIAAKWNSDTQVTLSYCDGATAFLARTRYGGVDIRHERSCPSTEK